jgi:hypothetical protein
MSGYLFDVPSLIKEPCQGVPIMKPIILEFLDIALRKTNLPYLVKVSLQSEVQQETKR